MISFADKHIDTDRLAALVRRIRSGPGSRFTAEISGALKAADDRLIELRDLLAGDELFGGFARFPRDLRTRMTDLRIRAALVLPALDEVLDHIHGARPRERS